MISIIHNDRFNTFIKSKLNNTDYMFIDPPWNYRPSLFSSVEFWRNINYVDLFQNLNTSTIFIWVTLDTLPAMIAGYIESSFELKSLIPYARVAKHEDVLYAIKQGFKYSFQYLAVLQTKDPKINNVFTKSIIFEEDNELQRPVVWEDRLFVGLAESGYKGLYLLPDGSVADTDISDRVTTAQMSKKELF